MANHINNFTSLFADDAKLYGKSSTQAERCSIQDDLNTLQQWSNTWRLSFNPTKCTALHLDKNNLQHNYVILSPSGPPSTLENTKSEKDLGVLINSELTFDKHISTAVKKAKTKLAMIRRTFTFMDKKMLAQLCSSLVRPIREYSYSESSQAM